MKKNAKIYVAGHRGLVGDALMKELQSNGYKNLITRKHSILDLTRQTAVENFFRNEKPEYVYLAAAKVGGILANDTYKAEFIYDNILIAANVIHSSYKFGVKKLLNFGSSCIYPKFAKQPMKEEYLLTGSLELTNEPYAIAKIASLKLCRYYNEQFGTNYISVMPTNLYGYNDNFNLETAHVLSVLIRKFHLAKLLKKNSFEEIRKDLHDFPLGFNLDINRESGDFKNLMTTTLRRLGITKDYVVLWGSGEPFREFLYVDDLADACVFMMSNYNYKEIGEFVNIGTGEDIKIKDLAKLVSEIVGFEGDVKCDLSKPEGNPKKLLDISKIKSMGWESKTSLKDGIKKTYRWYLEVMKQG